MYSDLIGRLRTAAAQARMTNAPGWADLMQEASDAIEALERNQGCPAWADDQKICSVFGMPVKEE